jgi:hypothetical protein
MMNAQPIGLTDEVPLTSVNRFPILSLDSELLNPAMGYCFEQRWVHRHESLLSLLWKFIAINCAPAHLVLRNLDPQCDPYWGITPIRTAALVGPGARMLRVSRNMIARRVLTQHAYDIAHPTFRHCPRCARRGFHSVLYQLASLTHCPLHKKTALVERCPKCKHRLRYELNVLTLEHPYRCTECRHRLNPRLIDQLQAKRQPNDCPVSAFESMYLRYGVPLLGYPGKRRMDDYTPRFAPKEILRALKDGKDTLNDDEWNALVQKIRPKSSTFTSSRIPSR